METNRTVSNSTGVTDGKLDTLREQKQHKCLEKLWLEHVNWMDTNRTVSDSTGVTDGRLDTLREQKQHKCLEQLWLEHI